MKPAEPQLYFLNNAPTPTAWDNGRRAGDLHAHLTDYIFFLFLAETRQCLHVTCGLAKPSVRRRRLLPPGDEAEEGLARTQCRSAGIEGIGYGPGGGRGRRDIRPRMRMFSG
jgi:hypothetical protein